MSTPDAPNIKRQPYASPNALEFAWAPPTSDGGSPITGYQLSLSGDVLRTQTFGPTERYAKVSTLTNAVNYYATLRAENTNGYGPTASFRLFNPGDKPPVNPSTSVAYVVNPTTTTVEWTPPSVFPATSPIEWYSIKSVSSDPADPVLKKTANASTLSSVTFTGLNPASRYNYRVQAVNCPGYSPSTLTNVSKFADINGAYLTNATIVTASNQNDASGNRWMAGQFQDPAKSVSIYNRLGRLVQTITPSSGTNVNNWFVAYISADGLSNIWIAKIIQGGNSFTFPFNSTIDGSGNFLWAPSFNATTIGSPNRYIVYDKTGAETFRYDGTDTSGSYSSAFVSKFSPAGAPSSGTADDNWWTCYGGIDYRVNFSQYGSRVTSIKTDKKNNPVILVSNYVTATTTNGAFKTFNRTKTQFGTTVQVTYNTNQTNGQQLAIVKFAANGTSTGAWNAYSLGSITASQSCITPILFGTTAIAPCLTFNSQNEILFCGQMTTSTASISLYGGDNSLIGANPIPITATTITSAVLVKLAENGAAAGSFRTTVRNSINRSFGPLRIACDSSDNIILNCYDTTATTVPTATITAYNSSDADVSITAVSDAAQNLYIVKYNNSGTPLWMAALRGNGPVPASGTSNLAASATAKMLVDPYNNILINGTYSRSTLSLFNSAGTRLQLLSSASALNNSFISKFSSDGTSGSIARIGTITGVETVYSMVLDLSNNIILTGTNDEPNHFFSASNDTFPLVSTQTNAQAGTFPINTWVARYDSNLNSVSVGRINLVGGSAAVSRPYYTTIDGSNNIIVCGAYNSTINVYNMGNYTTTPTYSTTNILAGNADLFLSKFTFGSTTPWTARIASGNTDSPNGPNTGESVEIKYTSLTTDSQNNIYASGGALLRPIVYDASNEPVYFAPGQTFNSSFTYILRFPSDGLQ